MTFAEYALAEGSTLRKLREARVPNEKDWAKKVLLAVRRVKGYKNAEFEDIDFSDEDDPYANLIIAYKVKGFTGQEDGGYNGDLAYYEPFEEEALKILSKFGKWEQDPDIDTKRNELGFRLLKLK